MTMVGFPLLLIPLAVFNIMVFLMPGVSFAAPVFSVTLLSETTWTVTVSDLMLAISVLLLMLEIIKDARGKYLTDHLLSLVLFGAAAAEFLLLPQFANSTFFMLALLTLVDFIAGISLRARRPKRVTASPVAATPVADPEPQPPRVDMQSSPPPSEEAPRPAPAAQRAEPVIVPPVVAANDSGAPVSPPSAAPESRPESETTPR
ncbi:MAG TPA: hypothetical protein VN130_10485 [Xanthobacteraceae bacterium]|nr:hypothetical protein [Xanthobacteraceae bacterium]